MSLNVGRWKRDLDTPMTKKVYGRILIFLSPESEIVVPINCQIEDTENHLQRIHI